MSEEGESLRIQTVLMLSLMVIAIIITTIFKTKGIHWISETSLYLIIGLIVGLIVVKGTTLLNFDEGHSKDFQLKSSFFYMVLLPPIIFEGGFTLQRVAFIRNLSIILGLALLGAMYSTVVTSALVYIFSRFLYPQMTLLDTLVFGSIISSTDPVSVLGMLPPTTDRNLYMMIFGESALNDAVALILYKFFTTLAAEQKELNAARFFQSLAGSIVLFLGSVLIGFVVALAFSLLTKHVKSPEAPIFEQLMFLVFAYTSYLLADITGFTGIISIFSCGIGMAHYAFANMSKVTLLSSKVFLRAFSSMCDAFVFLYLGLGLFAFGKAQTTYNPLFIICSFVAILIARTHVFIIGFFHNLVWRKRRPEKVVPMSHQVFLWFCGLRGAVSFALAVDTLDMEGISEDVRHLIFGTTICLVSITVLGLGGFTPLMKRLLKLDGSEHDDQNPLPDKEEGENQHGNSRPPKGMRRSVSQNTLDEYMPKDVGDAKEAAEFVETINNTGFWRRLYEFDKRWVQPLFTVSPKIKRGEIPGTNRHFRTHHGISSEDRSGNALDDSEDELDKVSIALAAEMIGIRGTTSQTQLPSDSRSILGGGMHPIYGKKRLSIGSRAALGSGNVRGNPALKKDQFLEDEDSDARDGAGGGEYDDDIELVQKSSSSYE